MLLGTSPLGNRRDVGNTSWRVLTDRPGSFARPTTVVLSNSSNRGRSSSRFIALKGMFNSTSKFVFPALIAMGVLAPGVASANPFHNHPAGRVFAGEVQNHAEAAKQMAKDGASKVAGPAARQAVKTTLKQVGKAVAGNGGRVAGGVVGGILMPTETARDADRPQVSDTRSFGSARKAE